ELNEQWTINAGWSLGWDSWWSNYLNASTALGGVTWTISETTSIDYQMSAGDFGDGTAKNGASSNEGDIYSHSIVFQTSPAPCWTYVFENTFGSNTGTGVMENEWYSLSAYLYHEVNELWSIGARIEWFRDDDGRAVDVNGAGRGSYYETTFGVNWQPTPNLRLRPEIRFDWFDGVGFPFDSRDGGMTGTAKNQMTVGFDAIMTF
ncbi:MAG: porin, partial [Pirellulales bacterium]|nr:porin [Pirellulales bacterium]